MATPTFVALIEWSDDEAGALHAFSCSVMHADGEVVSRSDGQTRALPRDGVLPSTTSAFMSVPFEARRAGLYSVEFRVDGDVVVSLPLNVTTTLPPIH